MNHSKASRNIESYSYTEISPLFKDILNTNKLVFLGAATTKLKTSANIFKCDSIYKLVAFNFPLKNSIQGKLYTIIKTENKETELSHNYVYVEPLGSDSHCFSFYYIAEDYPLADSLVLSIKGDSTQIINQNDSIINYFTYLKTMAININDTKVNYVYCDDHYVKYNAKSRLLPASILFLKKEGNIFLFIMGGVVQESYDFPKEYLYNLISRK